MAKVKRVKEETMKTPSEKAAKAIANLVAMKRGESKNEKFVTFAIKTVREATVSEIEEDPTAGKFVFVEGILAGEEPDFEGEILDYKSSKPNFQRWNEKAASLTGGKSVGNLRGQHNSKIAAGLFVDMQYDDTAKSIPCVAKVIDPVECDKVREGVYTSFSVGAHYARKWKDGKYVRWTADPFEGSLVDFGAIPMTRGFIYRSADGKEEERQFDAGRRELRKAFEAYGQNLSVEEEDRVVKTIGGLQAAQKGLYTISGFAQLVQSLIYLRDSIVYERETEGDDSPVTDRIAEATSELLECLAAYTQEQVSEEIGKKNPKEEKTVDIKDLTKDLPAAQAATTDPAAKAVTGEKPTDEQVVTATKAIGDSLAILKAAGVDLGAAFKGYPEHPGSDDHGKTAKPETDDDGDEDDKSKAKAKAAEECKKSADECKDEKCMTHKGKKTAAAGGNEGEALKRADVMSIVDNAIAAGFGRFAEKFEADVLAPFGEQLKTIGEAVAAIAGEPAKSSVATRAVTLVSKDAEMKRETEDADKAIREDVSKGRTVDAVLKIRSRGGVRVSQ